MATKAAKPSTNPTAIFLPTESFINSIQSNSFAHAVKGGTVDAQNRRGSGHALCVLQNLAQMHFPQLFHGNWRTNLRQIGTGPGSGPVAHLRGKIAGGDL